MQTVVKMQFGSHVYGTNLPTSDLDYKGIFVPSARDILLQRVPATISRSTKANLDAKNAPDDVDFELFSLQQFFHLLLQGQTVQIGMLFTPQQWIVESSETWERIKAQKSHWLHRGVSAFAGYCRQQANKYGIKGSRVSDARTAVTVVSDLNRQHGPRSKLSEHWDRLTHEFSECEHIRFLTETHPSGATFRMLEVCNRKMPEGISLKEAYFIIRRIFDAYGTRARQAETNDGVDWKAMMHATRVCYEAEELLVCRNVTYPRPEADLLLKIRKGEMPYRDVVDILEAGLVRLEELQRVSSLPETPNRDRANEFVLSVYGQEVAEYFDKRSSKCSINS